MADPILEVENPIQNLADEQQASLPEAERKGGFIYPTKPMAWGQFAEEVDYLNSTDDKRTLQQKHYNAINVGLMAEQAGLTSSETSQLRKVIDVYVPQWAEGQSLVNIANKGNGINGTNITNPDGIFTGIAKAASRGFGRSYTDTVAGAGDISNIIARNFNSESDFGAGVSALGRNWTDSVLSATKSNKDGFGYDVVEAMGQIAGLVSGTIATGGLGGVVKGLALTGRGLTAAQVANTAVKAGDAAKAASSMVGNLTKTGIITSAAGAQQVTEFINEYTDKLEETGEAIDVGTLNEILAASGFIGLLDSALPGRFLNVKYLNRARDAIRKNPGILKYGATGLVTEGLTEGGQKVIYNAIIRDTLIDEDRALLDGAVQEGAVGGVAGMVLGAIAGAFAPGRTRGRTGNLEAAEGGSQAKEIYNELQDLENIDSFSSLDFKPDNALLPESDDQTLIAQGKAVAKGTHPTRNNRSNLVNTTLETLTAAEPTFQFYNTLDQAEKDKVIAEMTKLAEQFSSVNTGGSDIINYYRKILDVLGGGSTQLNRGDYQTIVPMMSRVVRDVRNPPQVGGTTSTPPVQGTVINTLDEVEVGDEFVTKDGKRYTVARVNDGVIEYADPATGELVQLDVNNLASKIIRPTPVDPVVAGVDKAFDEARDNVNAAFDAADANINDQTPPEATPPNRADSVLASDGGEPTTSQPVGSGQSPVPLGAEQPGDIVRVGDRVFEIESIDGDNINMLDENNESFTTTREDFNRELASIPNSGVFRLDPVTGTGSPDFLEGTGDVNLGNNEQMIDPDDGTNLTEESIPDTQPNLPPQSDDPTKSPDEQTAQQKEGAQDKKDKPNRNSAQPEDLQETGAEALTAEERADETFAELYKGLEDSYAESIHAGNMRALTNPNLLSQAERSTAFDAAIKSDNAEGPSRKPDILQGLKNVWHRFLVSGGWLEEGERAHKEQLKRRQAKNPQIDNAEGPLSQSERYMASLRGSDKIVEAGLSDLNKSLREDFGTHVDSKHAEMVDLALRGNKESLHLLEQVAPKTTVVLAGMRVRIIKNSESIIRELFRSISRVTPLAQEDNNFSVDVVRTNQKILGELWKQAKILKASHGRYIHRTYLFNTNKEFANNALHDADLQRDARTFISTHYRTLNPRLPTESIADFNARTQSHTDAVVLEIFDKVGANSSGTHVTNTDGILLQQVSSFKDRTEVPASIRKMLGEIKDPSVNFATTIQQQELYLHSLQYANNMIRVGTQNGWMSINPDSSKGLIKRVKDEGANPAILLLSGTYTTENMAQGLYDYFHIDNQEGILRHVNAATALVKSGKTIYSPATANRNWLTALWQIGVGATFNPKGVSNAFRVSYENLTRKPGSPESRAYYQMLVEEGVAGDGISHQSMVQMMRDLAVYDLRTSDMFTATFNEAEANSLRRGSLFKSARDYHKFALKFYQAADDFPKIIAFEHNRNLLAKAYGKTIDDVDVIREAAQRVKFTHFTYSKVNKAVKDFRGLPFSTPFISFPAEVARTSKNWFTLMKRDLASGNPVLIRSAVLRGLSATATMTMTEQALEKFGEVFGDVTPEEQENGKESRSKFEVGTGVRLVYKHDDGTYEAVNMSRYNPYAMFSDAVDIFNTNPQDSVDSRIVRGVFKLMEPFVQEDITYSAVTEALGSANDDVALGYEDTTANFLGEVYDGIAPTALLQITSAYKAYSGDVFDYAGGEKDPLRETLKLFGASSQVFNFNKNLQFSGFEYSSVRNDTTRQIKRLAEDISSFKVRDVKDIIMGMEYRAQQKWGYLIKDVAMMKGRGLSDRDIETLLKRKGTAKNAGGMLTAEEFRLLMNGAPAPRVEYPTQAVETIVQRVLAASGPEASIKVRAALEEVRVGLGI